MTKDSIILLYGSYARGDADSVSDIDVLVVSPIKPQNDEISKLLPKSYKGILHTSHYTWKEFSLMSSYGSLFLHHIATEAKIIRFGGDALNQLNHLLAELPSYQLAKRDLSSFRITINDVTTGLGIGLPPCFELAVLGGVARHASVLGCYIMGKPTYGRRSISQAAELFQMSAAIKDLELAHRFRLYEEGQCELPSEVSLADVTRTVQILSTFLDRIEEAIYADAA
jgi:hypothetical protein